MKCEIYTLLSLSAESGLRTVSAKDNVIHQSLKALCALALSHSVTEVYQSILVVCRKYGETKYKFTLNEPNFKS